MSFKPVVEIKQERWDDETIMVITRRTSPHTSQSMVWAMTRDELVDLKSKIDGFLEDSK